MSWNPGVPNVAAVSGSAGNAALDGGMMFDGGAAGMSMLDANGNLITDLDMDMSLPMDLNMDLTVSQATDRDYRNLQQQSRNGDASMSMAEDIMSGNMTNSALPPESNSTGAGAGPLPTGFGMQTSIPSSTLTEFTKRRNWSQRIIEELKDFLHILTPDGRILYVSPSCKSITGYEPHTLIGKFIGEFVHPDDSGIFMREFNESIASGNTLRFFYRFKKEDGTYMIFESDGHPHLAPENGQAGFNGNGNNGNAMQTGVCRGFFMMARPYPTKNAALLDSFLEHKIENERLLKRIEELKREEAEENAEQDRLYRENTSNRTPSDSQAPTISRIAGDGNSEAPVSTPNYQGMPPPAKPPISNTALTRQNLDSALLTQKPDSIADKMSRYEANNTHLESIELLTGLRYRDGERSHGISTGDTSPALIRGDAGIAILLDRDREANKKEKKKMRVADEYVCADCGTLDSPEWRKGPKGPKTLCNACGLRWAKKEKKRGGDDGKATSPASLSHHASPRASSMHSMNMGRGMNMQPPGLPMQSSTGSS